MIDPINVFINILCIIIGSSIIGYEFGYSAGIGILLIAIACIN